jgi:TusA-related sulfurtransferase
MAESFGTALGNRDYEGLARCFASDAEMDAILPGGQKRVTGRDQLVATWSGWLDWAREVQVEEVRVSEAGDRTTLTWRCILTTDDPTIGDRVMEQHMVLITQDGVVHRIALVCTGMRRVADKVEPRIHDVDAGNLGCGDGFPSVFRRQMETIGIGECLRLTASDPAAKQDVPSLTRLMGHRLIEITDLPQGRTAFTVQRVH